VLASVLLGVHPPALGKFLVATGTIWTHCLAREERAGRACHLWTGRQADTDAPATSGQALRLVCLRASLRGWASCACMPPCARAPTHTGGHVQPPRQDEAQPNTLHDAKLEAAGCSGPCIPSPGCQHAAAGEGEHVGEER